MELNEFELYVIEADNFTPSEIKEFKLMKYNELKGYQIELERDGGNLSNWDHLRAFFTLKHEVQEQDKRINELEDEVRLWKSNCGEYDDEDEDMEDENE